MRRSTVRGFVFPGLLLALAGPVLASPLIRRTLPELAQGADLIFIGRCEAVSSHWNEDRSLIFTANRFHVTRALKGDPGDFLVLDEAGGKVGATGMHVADIPRFSVGEEVLLCVRRTELGRWVTFGALQGKFPITRDGRGQEWVHSDLYGPQLAAMMPGRRGQSDVPLARFVGRLQAWASERSLQ